MPGKAALVTGASKGIGRAVAKRLADTGLTIIAVARNEKELESLKDEIESSGGICQDYPADLTNEKKIDDLINHISSLDLKIALVVHSAGVAHVGRIESFPIADWRKTLETNLTTPFLLTQKSLPLLAPSAHLFFVNSVAGYHTFPEWSAYCVSKYGLRALADTLRKEQAVNGIKITSVYPTSVDTPMQDKLPYDWDRSKMLNVDDVARAIMNCYQQDDNVLIKEIILENIAGTF